MYVFVRILRTINSVHVSAGCPLRLYELLTSTDVFANGCVYCVYIFLLSVQLLARCYWWHIRSEEKWKIQAHRVIGNTGLTCNISKAGLPLATSGDSISNSNSFAFSLLFSFPFFCLFAIPMAMVIHGICVATRPGRRYVLLGDWTKNATKN